MKSILRVLALLISIALLAACLPSLGGGGQDTPQPTEKPIIEPTEEPLQPTEESPQPTEPPTEEPTEPPVIPTEEVSAEITANANCRSGPGSIYDNIILLKPGATGKVIGMNQDGSLWYKLELLDGKQCWVTAGVLALSGDTASVQNLAAPPTPTPVPAPDWNGRWVIWIWWDQQGNDIFKTEVDFYQTGDEFTASFYRNSVHQVIYGTVSTDGMSIDAYLYSGGTGPYPVVIERNPNNLNQFRGIWTGWWGVSGADGDFCGAKNGAGKPDPCRIIR